MNDKLSYKIKFLLIYTIAVAIAIYLVFFTLGIIKSSDVSTISEKHINDTIFEKTVYFEEYLSTYKATLTAISEDSNFQNFLSTNKYKSHIQNYFLTIKKSLPNATQIRYIDTKGNEIVRVDGLTKKIRIVPQNELQNKSSRYYVKEFLALPKNTIGMSNIDLNIEHGKVITPKEPTIRMGKIVYDKNGAKKGIVLINILLSPFFENLQHTELFNISLVDSKGKILVHYTKNYGLLGENQNYTLKDEYPKEWENILKNEKFSTHEVYSSKIATINKQDIKIVLKPKYYDLSIKNQNIKDDLIIVLIFTAFLFSPLVIYFAYLPDNLAKKSLQEHSTDKKTGYPNRLCLMNDLKTDEFDGHLIILIYLNNIFKIQNTYGYKVSDKLITVFTKFLANYEGIEKVYVNNYNSFVLKYKYEDDEELKTFLDTLTFNLEKNQFNLPNENLEFLLQTVIGVSNPNNLTNNLEKLHQAENALEMASENHKNIDIYGSVHERNIDSKKQNISLAHNIKKCIDADKILVYYQPIYNNFTEKIEKYECLMRIEGIEGIIYPDTFLPVAKEIKQYNRLSYILVKKAFEFFRDKDYEFSINLSLTDLYDVKFQEYFFKQIKKYKVQKRLVVEIVESESINNYEIFFEFAKKIKDIGSKIAIDDFGSGYSNFNYIIELSEYIDYLKIDGSLVKNIVDSHKVQILIGSLKFLSDNLGIQTIAEYVEDEEVLRYLSSIGIDYSQGYYIGKPEATLKES